ncbi:hypothetical protein P153DRAFT_278681, partial [Dothidotthia symphoricarpi CBS 119687]
PSPSPPPAMVLLTMTPGIVRAVAKAAELSPDAVHLADPKPGNPISHSQLISLSKLLKAQPPTDSDDDAPTLAALLQNTTLYTPPPAPKPAQTPAYTALMARLRAQEEARSYERMLHPPPTRESFNQRFPSAPHFSVGALHTSTSEEDDVSYEEVHRQIILIINVIVSIVCVAVFVWVAARHWTVGKRLGLSMGSSGAVAIAEVVVYSGYVRKVQEAKRLEKKKPEIKEIVASWILDKSGEVKDAASAKEKEGDGVRFRKGKHR